MWRPRGSNKDHSNDSRLADQWVCNHMSPHILERAKPFQDLPLAAKNDLVRFGRMVS